MARSGAPSVLKALNDALKAAKPTAVDAATVALAQRYAAELDGAEVVNQRMVKALRRLARHEVPQDLFEDFESIATALTELNVASQIGPKLLDALDKLQLTPAARKAVANPPPGGGGGSDPGSSALGNVRALGANRAKAVDASAS